MPSRHWIDPLRLSASSSSSPSTRSKRPTSSRNSRSSAGRWDHSRDSIQPATTSFTNRRSPGAGPSPPARSRLRCMRRAIGQPPDSAATAARRRRDSVRSKKRAISGVEKRRSSASSISAGASSTAAATSSAGGSSRPASARCRLGGAAARRRPMSAAAGGSASRSSSSSASTNGAPFVLDGAQQQGGALERAETGRGGGQRAGRVQPGALQGEREIGVEPGRPVAVVEEQPRGRDPAPGKFAAAGRQQGRLAESAGRLQRGHAPVGGQAARGELGTVQIARHPIGHGNPVREQPGRGRRRRAGRGGVRPALSSGQRPAPRVRPGPEEGTFGSGSGQKNARKNKCFRTISSSLGRRPEGV